MYHRYPYGPFAEYSEEIIRGNHDGHLTNVDVRSGDIGGQRRKESVWFKTEDSFRYEQRSAKGLAYRRSNKWSSAPAK